MLLHRALCLLSLSASFATQALDSVTPNTHQLISRSSIQSHTRKIQDFNLRRHIDPSFSKRDQEIKPSFDYAKYKIRGVNLGGWLVTEPWITPSLYNTGNDKIVDEYTLCEQLGQKAATELLRAHWESFYKEEDFQRISSYGLNHVRIPIEGIPTFMILGYWAFDILTDEPYVQGQLEYLHRAVGWAQGAGLKVMIDLHGAPGSQNGFDNSGKRGEINWASEDSNVARTRQALVLLAQEFSQPKYAGTVTSLESLNEPAGFANEKTLKTTRQYYYDGYGIVRYPIPQGSQSNLLYAIHDAFQPLDAWTHSFPAPKWQGVALDTHIYTVFNNTQLKMTDDERVKSYCDLTESLVQSDSSLWTFVGEFTPAPTDCAPRLNGQGIGSRYDATFKDSPRLGSCEGKSGSMSSFSEEYKASLGRFFEVQTHVFEKASGWFMWTFKAENSDDWSYDAGVKGGWIPRDPGFKAHGNPCG
ncbi:family 5 glycoside hydrolase [Melampsora larici-populina 98AG31]|uniref:glucan 1,3-beta-glucosidase n=1 Tax=Melampsora larici-populina (strain 98AG31 / pathotype 3-4-7) TaxID=747676 RepID=F4RGN0_MELLP|nr:family 5 glycoside hydrolase [Melampsora larici-populina 98AG31]EGG08561.1 family 5 glycoside hydrolase [Melampsora larici-populina 98AG31]